MVLRKVNVFGRITFPYNSILDSLEEPKHSAPNLYASDFSDLAPCQIFSMGIEYGSFTRMGLG